MRANLILQQISLVHHSIEVVAIIPAVSAFFFILVESYLRISTFPSKSFDSHTEVTRGNMWGEWEGVVSCGGRKGFFLFSYPSSFYPFLFYVTSMLYSLQIKDIIKRASEFCPISIFVSKFRAES